MILIDANIPMYLVGAEHPNKHAAAAAVESAVAAGQRLVTDAEVLQELLHRFVAIQRPLAIQPAFDVLLSVVEETLPVELTDVQLAKEIVLAGYRLSSRDALHIAIMRHHGLDTVMSFDRGFERYPGITRIS